MRTGKYCKECLLRSEERKVEQEQNWEKKQLFLDQVRAALRDEDLELSPPEYLAEFTELYERHFGAQTAVDPLKRHFNELMLKKEPEIRKRIEASEDPVATAIQAAQAGNYIDYIALGEIDGDQLEQLLFQNREKGLKPEVYDSFKADLSSAKNLVYITDNCGEIVVDKVLIQELKKFYPQVDVTVIVRGASVANDASMEDAVQVGLSDEARVIGNGTRIAGTSLNRISREAKEIIGRADVIIAKGQGNYETLSGCGLNVYYLFLCKCDYFVKRFEGEYLQHMFIKEKI